MSKQNIEIEVPDGFEAKYNPETQKIELVKKDDKPRTWEEFCEKYPIECTEAYINSTAEIIDYSTSVQIARNKYYHRNNCVSREEAEAFRALIQLRQLRKAWIGDWEPNYSLSRFGTYSIRRYNGKEEFLVMDESVTGALVFPTREMAKEFLNCFYDLIEKAKALL